MRRAAARGRAPRTRWQPRRASARAAPAGSRRGGTAGTRGTTPARVPGSTTCRRRGTSARADGTCLRGPIAPPSSRGRGSTRGGAPLPAAPRPSPRCRCPGNRVCRWRTTDRRRPPVGARRRPAAGATVPSAHLAQLALQVVDLVTQAGGVLEAQVGGRLVHLLLQRADEPAQLV